MVFVEVDKRRIVMVNPEITDVGAEDFEVWDDCFCFPDLMVRVTRAHRVSLRYWDLKAREHAVELEGGMAELVQHEIDHLDGILALDRASGLDPFAYRSEWARHHHSADRHGTPAPREVA